MATGAQPIPEASTRTVLDKLANAIDQENSARSEISATMADLGDWITTVEVATLPEQIKAVILVDRTTGRQRLFYEFRRVPIP
jgi:hypothetical protein